MATVGKVILWSRACMARACCRRDIFLCRGGRAEVYYGMGAILYDVVGLPAVRISIIILVVGWIDRRGGPRSHHLTPSIKKTKIAN